MSPSAITGWTLMLRARRIESTLLALVLLCTSQRLFGTAALRLNPDESLIVPWAVVVPMLSGTFVAVTCGSGAHILELGTSRSLTTLRLTHLTAVIVAGLASTSIGTWGLAGALTGPAALRNFLGFVGLGYLSALLIGPALAWTLPLTYGAAALTAGAQQGQVQIWAWPIGDNADATAFAFAMTLALFGILGIAIFGPRITHSEDHET